MKTAFLRASLCIVIVTMGYVGCWFYAVKKLHRSLITESGDHFQYDSITYVGFPFKVGINIKNPVYIEGNQTKISTTGEWEAGITTFGDKAWFAISGKTTYREKDSIIDKSVLSGQIHLQILSSSSSFKALVSFKEIFLGHQPDWSSIMSLGGFNIHVENLAFFLKENTEPLYEIDLFSCDLIPMSEKTSYKASACLNSNLRGLRTNEEQLSMLRLQQNSHGIFPWRLEIDNFALQSHFRVSDEKGNIRSLLELKKCHLSNPTFTSELGGNIALNQNGPISSLSLSLNLAGEIIKPSEKKLLLIRQDMAQIGLEQDSPNSSAFSRFFSDHPDEANDFLSKMSYFGPFAHQIELDMEMWQEGSVTQSIKCDLKRFHTTIPGNEIDIKGYFALPESQQTPFLELQISNSDMMWQNLLETYQQIRKLIITMHPEEAHKFPSVNPQVAGKIRHFLDFLSLEKDPSKWHFIIRGKNLNELSVVPYDQNTFFKKVDKFTTELLGEFPSFPKQNRKLGSPSGPEVSQGNSPTNKADNIED